MIMTHETISSEITEPIEQTQGEGEFEFSGGVTAILQGTSGVESDDTQDQIDASTTADFEMVYGYDSKYYLIVALESGHGEGVNNNFPTDITPNYDVYVTATHPHQQHEDVTLSQAYFEGLFFDRKFVVNIGKMDVHALYDTNLMASDETTNFMASPLVRAAGTVSNELDDYYSPAVRLYFAPWDWIELDAIYSHSQMEDFSRNHFSIFQLTLKPGLGGLEGNYRLYVAHDGRSYEDIDGEMKNDLIWGLSFDQYLSDNIGLFFRYSAHDENLVDNKIVSLISGGVTLSGGAWGRVDDLLGVGYAQLALNDNLNLPYDEGQSVWEIYYNARLNPMISITPDVQIHQNLPREKDREVTIYGIRAQVDF